MRPLIQGRVFCCLSFFSDSSYVVCQQFAFKYEQNAHMCYTHTCHKFLKTFIVKKEFHLQPELLEVSGEGKPYFQDLVVLVLWCQRIIRVLREAHILCTSGRGRECPYRENSWLMGFKTHKSSHSNSSVLKQGCSIISMTYFVFFVLSEFVQFTAENLV